MLPPLIPSPDTLQQTYKGILPCLLPDPLVKVHWPSWSLVHRDVTGYRAPDHVIGLPTPVAGEYGPQYYTRCIQYLESLSTREIYKVASSFNNVQTTVDNLPVHYKRILLKSIQSVVASIRRNDSQSRQVDSKLACVQSRNMQGFGYGPTQGPGSIQGSIRWSVEGAEQYQYHGAVCPVCMAPVDIDTSGLKVVCTECRTPLDPSQKAEYTSERARLRGNIRKVLGKGGIAPIVDAIDPINDPQNHGYSARDIEEHAQNGSESRATRRKVCGSPASKLSKKQRRKLNRQIKRQATAQQRTTRRLTPSRVAAYRNQVAPTRQAQESTQETYSNYLHSIPHWVHWPSRSGATYCVTPNELGMRLYPANT